MIFQILLICGTFHGWARCEGQGLGLSDLLGLSAGSWFYEASAAPHSCSTCHNKGRPSAEHTNVAVHAFREQRNPDEQVVSLPWTLSILFLPEPSGGGMNPPAREDVSHRVPRSFLCPPWWSHPSLFWSLLPIWLISWFLSCSETELASVCLTLPLISLVSPNVAPCIKAMLKRQADSSGGQGQKWMGCFSILIDPYCQLSHIPYWCFVSSSKLSASFLAPYRQVTFRSSY